MGVNRIEICDIKVNCIGTENAFGSLAKVSSMPYSSAPIWFLLEDMVLKFHHFLQGIE